ncbi:LamG domain-containing protein [bacterium]|nr:LamG domain-containing protein [bacterium]
MGIHRGPNIEKGGLVFGYDTGYGLSGIDTTTRFYRGKPTTNYLSDGLSGYNVVQGSNWNGATPTYTLGTSEFNTPIGTYNTSGTSYMYSHDLVLDDDLSTLSSQVVTFSVYLKRTGNVADVGIRVYDNVSGYSTSYVPVTNNFQRFYLTKTLGTNPTRIFVMIDNTNGGVIDFHSPMLEKGTSSPFVDGIRGGEESLYDFKRSIINLDNVSFDSVSSPPSYGQPVLDGTNDYLVSTDNFLIKGDQTWEIVAMANGGPDSPAGILTNHHFQSPQSNFGINYVSGNRLGASIGYTNGSREYASKNTNYVIQVGVPFHAVLKYDSSNNTIEWFINGESDSTYSLSATPNFISQQICSGRWTPIYNDYYFNGEVYVGKVYGRALTPDEIRKNYKAYKNRFNL